MNTVGDRLRRRQWFASGIDWKGLHLSTAQPQLRLVSAATAVVAPVRLAGRSDRECRAEISTKPGLDGEAYETTVSGDLPLTPFMRMPAPGFRKALQQHAAHILPATFGRELAERKLTAGCKVVYVTPDEVVRELTLSLLDRQTLAALKERDSEAWERRHKWEAQGSAWLGLAHFADRLAIFANSKKGVWPSMW